VHNYVIENQEKGKSPQIRGGKSSTQGDLVHIIKKDRLPTRYFAAILRGFAAVHSGNVVP